MCLFFNYNVPLQIRILRDLKPEKSYQIYYSAISIFVDEKVLDDGFECAFLFLPRNCCVKNRKIKGLDACDNVEIWRLKTF